MCVRRQLEAELSAQRAEEQRLKEQLQSTVKERELLSWAIEDSRVAAQAEAEARAKVEFELAQQVCRPVTEDCRTIMWARAYCLLPVCFPSTRFCGLGRTRQVVLTVCWHFRCTA